jgi:hypothetical protein
MGAASPNAGAFGTARAGTFWAKRPSFKDLSNGV